ncbi:unnamed protein product [Cyclocybe aegerita]|uniref:Uncharacterized protein n=1 Tax=Cyclocybe aegerita TaxID=1973307 RepID=A0A8S0WX89_CYCAE|nr:unnamed protein product [Cyclocybe aegerita]
MCLTSKKFGGMARRIEDDFEAFSEVKGAVVGGLFCIFFICMLTVCGRRRRQNRVSAVTATLGGGPPQPQFGAKPMFGGPWGRSNVGESSPNYQPPQAAYNPEYPPQNAPLPPPAYGQDANYGGGNQAPQGAPQGQPSDNLYAPPPSPPPPEATKGNNQSFIGGF